MIEFVYTPRWFFGKDIFVDCISLFVLLLIAFFSWRSYNIKKNKNYLYLVVSFSMLILSFLFEILMNFTLIYEVYETKKIGLITLTYESIKSSNSLFFIGFLLYRVFALLGFFLLYSIYHKQSKYNIFLITYLLILVTYFTHSTYYIFHLTLFIFLILITAHHNKSYLNQRYPTTGLVAVSFGIISLGQIFFMFVDNTQIYILADIIQLIGYIILLYTFLTVLKYGRKKNQN